MADPHARLTIYSRRDCHLCDVMHGELQNFVAGRGLGIAIIDVDDTPELAKRYGTRVPVLLLDGTEVCHYRLNRRLLSEVLGPV